MGHSSGEMAAAYAAGRITAAEAITAAYYRVYMVSFNKQKGAMLAIGLGLDQGAEYTQEAGLGEKVKIAAINSPGSVTMSGDAEAIKELSAEMSQEAIFNRIVRTNGLAYHSHHMLRSPWATPTLRQSIAETRVSRKIVSMTRTRIIQVFLGFRLLHLVR